MIKFWFKIRNVQLLPPPTKPSWQSVRWTLQKYSGGGGGRKINVMIEPHGFGFEVIISEVSLWFIFSQFHAGLRLATDGKKKCCQC